VCACELAAELVKSKAAGQMTERFAVLAENIGRGWFAQRSASGWAHAVDDVMGLFRLRLMRDWVKADPKRNVFAFLTGMARFSGMDWQRKYDAVRKREGNVTLHPQWGGEC